MSWQAGGGCPLCVRPLSAPLCTRAASPARAAYGTRRAREPRRPRGPRRARSLPAAPRTARPLAGPHEGRAAPSAGRGGALRDGGPRAREGQRPAPDARPARQ